MSIKVDSEFFISRYGTLRANRGTSSVPLNNIAMGLGIRYAF
jgi:hypothetical protein